MTRNGDRDDEIIYDGHMMNDETHKGWGYDPTDQTSFPYQANDPPFSAADLVPDPVSLEAAMNGTLQGLNEFLVFLTNDAWMDGANGYAVWDMALRLFRAMTNDPQNAYEGIAYPDLLAVAIDTSILWAVG